MSAKKMEKDKIVELLHELAQAYFIDRDYGKLMAHISTKISWIGTGANEICRSIADAIRYLKVEKEIYKGKFVLSNEWYHVTMISDDLACAMATMEVDADPASGYLIHMSLRFSVVLIRKGGGSGHHEDRPESFGRCGYRSTWKIGA